MNGAICWDNLKTPSCPNKPALWLAPVSIEGSVIKLLSRPVCEEHAAQLHRGGDWAETPPHPTPHHRYELWRATRD